VIMVLIKYVKFSEVWQLHMKLRTTLVFAFLFSPFICCICCIKFLSRLSIAHAGVLLRSFSRPFVLVISGSFVMLVMTMILFYFVLFMWCILWEPAS